MIGTVEMPDDELVAQSLDGNRDAFGRIVSRYQSLIYSLAYSATGSLGQSEDLAQETFIMAWKHLRQLRLAASRMRPRPTTKSRRSSSRRTRFSKTGKSFRATSAG
jgi:Sigma-70 region 2